MAAHWSRSRDARLSLGKWMHEEKANEGKCSRARQVMMDRKM